MIENFLDVRLPDEIEVGATGGPAFLTNVISVSSGAEQRNLAWAQQRIMWTVGYGCQSVEDWTELLEFFYEARGRGYSFRFRDWSDGSELAPVADQVIGTGDGVQRVFHLVRTYGVTNPFTRYIMHPDWDTVTVKVDGVLNTDWEEGEKGTLVWDEGQEPVGEITWSGQFDALVRFDVDQFSASLDALASGTISGLNIIEVRENPNLPPIDITFAGSVTSLAEHTTAQTFLADLVAVDDGLGTNVIGLQAFVGNEADLDLFEVVDDQLFLKADVDPTFGDGPLKVTVTVYDTTVGDIPSATRDFTLTITNVVEAPTVDFSSTTHNVILGASTASPTVIADIDVTSEVAYVLSLTGADAADFDIVGAAGSEQLRLKAGVSTAVALHKAVNVSCTNVAAAPMGEGGVTVENFSFTIGMVAGEEIFDTVGDFTFTVPVYNTLEIDVVAAGCGSWGYSAGSTTAPTEPGETYCQTDQTITALSRWHVEPYIQDDNGDAYTPGTLVATAKMDSFGIGASLTASSGGQFGAIGYSTAQNPYPGRGLPSGKGGDATIYDSGSAAGGASLNDAAPNPPGSVATVATAGNDGAAPGAGAGGGIYKLTNNVISYRVFPIPAVNYTIDAGMAGGGSGMYAKRTWAYGSAQSGVGADYLAPAPVINDTLYVRIGAGGVGGAGTVAGGDGGHGRVRIKWS